MDVGSFTVRRRSTGGPSWSGSSFRTLPRIHAASNRLSPMMEAKPGKSTGSQSTRGRRKQLAISQKLFTAKDAKDATERRFMKLFFFAIFAIFAPFAVCALAFANC